MLRNPDLDLARVRLVVLDVADLSRLRNDVREVLGRQVGVPVLEVRKRVVQLGERVGAVAVLDLVDACGKLGLVRKGAVLLHVDGSAVLARKLKGPLVHVGREDAAARDVLRAADGHVPSGVVGVDEVELACVVARRHLKLAVLLVLDGYGRSDGRVALGHARVLGVVLGDLVGKGARRQERARTVGGGLGRYQLRYVVGDRREHDLALVVVGGRPGSAGRHVAVLLHDGEAVAFPTEKPARVDGLRARERRLPGGRVGVEEAELVLVLAALDLDVELAVVQVGYLYVDLVLGGGALYAVLVVKGLGDLVVVGARVVPVGVERVVDGRVGDLAVLVARTGGDLVARGAASRGHDLGDDELERLALLDVALVDALAAAEHDGAGRTVGVREVELLRVVARLRELERARAVVRDTNRELVLFLGLRDAVCREGRLAHHVLVLAEVAGGRVVRVDKGGELDGRALALGLRRVVCGRARGDKLLLLVLALAGDLVDAKGKGVAFLDVACVDGLGARERQGRRRLVVIGKGRVGRGVVALVRRGRGELAGVGVEAHQHVYLHVRRAGALGVAGLVRDRVLAHGVGEGLVRVALGPVVDNLEVLERVCEAVERERAVLAGGCRAAVVGLVRVAVRRGEGKAEARLAHAGDVNVLLAT